MMDHRPVGEMLRNLRLRRRLSELQVARAVGYRHGGTIRRIEKGILPLPFTRVDLYADALGIERVRFWSMVGQLRIKTIEAPGQAPELLPTSINKRLARMQRSCEFWKRVRSSTATSQE